MNNKRTLSEREQDYQKGRRDALRQLQRELADEAFQISKLLENGRPIFEQATGRRFENMYTRRYALHYKVINLWKMCGRIEDEIQKTKK